MSWLVNRINVRFNSCGVHFCSAVNVFRIKRELWIVNYCWKVSQSQRKNSQKFKKAAINQTKSDSAWREIFIVVWSQNGFLRIIVYRLLLCVCDCWSWTYAAVATISDELLLVFSGKVSVFVLEIRKRAFSTRQTTRSSLPSKLKD